MAKKKKSGTRPRIFQVDIKGNKIKKLKEWKLVNPGKLYFDSDFERKAYILFEDAGFNFEFQPPARELLPPLTAFALSSGKSKKLFRSSVRPLTYTMDFAIHTDEGTTIWIEVKGFFHPDARIRFKLFQHSLSKKEMCLLVKYGGLQDPMVNVKAVIKIIKENFMDHEKQNVIDI